MERLGKISTLYGSPMGRPAYPAFDPALPVVVFRVTLYDGGYDKGGAYWGTPNNLFCATDDEKFRVFHRCGSHQTMVDYLTKEYPGIIVKDEFDFDAFLDGYLECAAWSGPMDEDRDKHDGEFTADDFTKDAIRKARKACKDFVQFSGADLVGLDPSQCGHDFWLTRNHHGAGFWDRGLGDRGKRLTKDAQAFGGCDVWVSRVGKLHFS